MTEIRRATEADLAGIAGVILESWRRTYDGVLGPDYLAGPVEDDLAELWRPARLSGAAVLVAVEAGGVAGVVATLPEDSEGPYVDNLHVAKSFEGQGLGRALMAATASEMLALGHDRLHLTVAVSNARAIAFYRRLGGAFGAAFEDEMFGNPVMAYPVHWADLDALAGIGRRVPV